MLAGFRFCLTGEPIKGGNSDSGVGDSESMVGDSESKVGDSVRDFCLFVGRGFVAQAFLYVAQAHLFASMSKSFFRVC